MSAVFNLVYSLLLWTSQVSGLSYEAVNVIAYYFLAPLVFLFLVDRIIKRHVCVPCFVAAWCLLLFWIPSFDDFADTTFERSVDFLNAFSAAGWNYTVASVLVCVVAPGILFVVLFYYAFPKLFRQYPLIRKSE